MKQLTIDVSKILCNKEWLNPYSFGHTKDVFVSYLDYMIECKEESMVEKIEFADDFFTFTIFGKNLHSFDWYIELFNRD